MPVTSWVKRPTYRFWRVAIPLVGFDLVVTLVVWLGTHALIVRPQVLPADAPLVVFYTPEPRGFEDRVATAANVYRTHGRRAILCVGGSRPSRHFFGSDAMANRLAAHGVAQRDLRTEHRSFDTSDNIAAAIALAGPVRGLILVSDALHLIRIRRLVTVRHPAEHPILYPTPMVASPATAWWRVHYEMIAWASLLLPDGWRLWLLRTARP